MKRKNNWIETNPIHCYSKMATINNSVTDSHKMNTRQSKFKKK